MLAEEIVIILVVPVLPEIGEGKATLDSTIRVRMVHFRELLMGQLLWIQFWPFTMTCWCIKFSLLAFYSRLFYLYSRSYYSNRSLVL
jgi:hypothetical protein